MNLSSYFRKYTYVFILTIQTVAWMKRSVIRECDAPFFPDYAALHPGYNCNLRNTCVNL